MEDSKFSRPLSLDRSHGTDGSIPFGLVRRPARPPCGAAVTGRERASPSFAAAALAAIGAACASLPARQPASSAAVPSMSESSRPPTFRWRTDLEQIGGPIRCDPSAKSATTDKDGGHYACAIRSEGRAQVFLDGRESPWYEDVAILGFSPGGHELAYTASLDGKTHVIVADKRGPPYDAIQSFAFSPNGRFAYVGRLKNRVQVVIDGRTGPEFEGVEKLAFSGDGARVAYIGRAAGKASVVVDENPERAYDTIRFFGFSEGGRALAYLGTSGEVDHVVIDGKVAIADGKVESLVLSEDGKRHAYSVRKGSAVRAVVDGTPEPEHRAVLHLAFYGESSKHLAYLAIDSDLSLIVHDGRNGRGFDELLWAASSPDGEHMALGVHVAHDSHSTAVIVDDEMRSMPSDTTRVRPVGFTKDGRYVTVREFKTESGSKACVLVDGQSGPEFEAVEEATLSSDGARLAYVGRSGERARVVLDGQLGPTHARVPRLLFSPDGRHLAYLAASTAGQGARMRVLLDGAEWPAFKFIPSMTFSSDGRRLAAVAVESENEGRVVVDGQPGPSLSSLASIGIERSGAFLAQGRSDLRCRPGENMESGCSHDVLVRFSEDGRSFLYLTAPDGKPRVILDGVAMPQMDQILFEDLGFAADGSVSYFAKRDGALFRVRHRREPVQE